MLERHPWNREFSWQQPDGPYRLISDAQAQAYRAEGFFLLEGAFDAATVARLLDEIDPLEAQTEAYLRRQPERRRGISRAGEITFCPHLVTQSDYLKDFCGHPVFQGLVHDLVGPDVRLYWDQSVYKKPGTPQEFPWHQDNGYTYVEPQQYLTCWVALTEATPENGCPWVMPGGHRPGTLRHWQTEVGYQCLESTEQCLESTEQCLESTEGARALPVKPGSIAVFSSLTPHRTGPNVTTAIRKAYIVQFAPDGAVMCREGEAPRVCNAPERQYPVLVGGEPVRDLRSGDDLK